MSCSLLGLICTLYYIITHLTQLNSTQHIMAATNTKQKQKTAAKTVPPGQSYGAFFERNWGKIFLFTLFFTIVLYAVYVTYTINATIRQATAGFEHITDRAVDIYLQDGLAAANNNAMGGDGRRRTGGAAAGSG